MLPNDTLFDILADLRRRDLDALELVNRALGSLIPFVPDAPRRVLSLTFNKKGYVQLTCSSDAFRRVPVVELPPYLPRSVITKMIFTSAHTITEGTYQGEGTALDPSGGGNFLN